LSGIERMKQDAGQLKIVKCHNFYSSTDMYYYVYEINKYQTRTAGSMQGRYTNALILIGKFEEKSLF
jgi:hypothetical protein